MGPATAPPRTGLPFSRGLRGPLATAGGGCSWGGAGRQAQGINQQNCEKGFCNPRDRVALARGGDNDARGA
eukprot:4495390-Alexandrium_andersonii.AAC.1